jgi:hypothetical protein
MLRGGAATLGCLLGAVIIVVAVPLPHAAQPATVSYAADQAKLARLAPYPAVAPAGLPASWQPVSSGLTVGGANGAGTVTWQLGFTTPDGLLASLEESNAAAAGFIRRMTNDGTDGSSIDLNGRAWSSNQTPTRGQRSLYFTGAAGLVVVVTGNASWAQLRQLAASLRPLAASLRQLAASLRPLAG